MPFKPGDPRATPGRAAGKKERSILPTLIRADQPDEDSATEDGREPSRFRAAECADSIERAEL